MINAAGSREWYHCHGSQVMQEGQPNNKGDSTREGIAASWVGANILLSYVIPNTELLYEVDFLKKVSPNGILIDDEMCQGAMMYVHDVLAYCNQTGLLKSAHVEEELDLSCILPGMQGTPNSYVWNPSDLELIIWDLEFGYGHVEAFENPKLMIYIAGILRLHNLEGQILNMITVKMRIIQPRSFHGDSSVREWVIKASELVTYFSKLRYAAAQSMSGEGLCVPGTHCHYCRGRNSCAAITKTLYNYIDIVTGPVPMGLEGHALVLEWQLLNRIEKLLKYRKSGIDGQIEASLRNGDHLAGAKLAKSLGRERWKKDTPVKKVLAMAQMYGADISKPENLDTPNQALVKIKSAAKKFKVNIDKSLLSEWVETPFKGYKVVEDDGSEANKVFK